MRRFALQVQSDRTILIQRYGWRLTEEEARQLVTDLEQALKKLPALPESNGHVEEREE